MTQRRNGSILMATGMMAMAVWLFGGTGPDGRLLAQVDDPFGIGDPVAEPDMDQPELAPPTPAEEEERETDPIVLMIQDSEPRTPLELLRVVKILMDIGRHDVARGYLERFEEIELDQAGLLRLQRRFGDAFLIRLRSSEPLAPEGQELAERILRAAQEQAADPERIAELVERLADRDERPRALGQLRRMSRHVVGELLSQLADQEQSDRHQDLQRALVALDREAAEPILGALESPDRAFRLRVLKVLTARGDRSVVQHLIPLSLDPETSGEVRESAEQGLKRLLGYVPSRSQGTDLLDKRFRQVFSADPVLGEEEITLWRWDENQRTVVARPGTAADRQRLEAYRLAVALHEAAPDRDDFRMYRLAAELELEQALAGWDFFLDTETGVIEAALEAGPDVTNGVLRFALREGRVAGAVAAARVLGASGTMTHLQSDQGGLSPLAEALHDRHQLVQAAAMEAIMRIQPREAFPGSHRFAEVMAYFLRSRPARQALVIHPRVDEGRTLIGLLEQSGFEGQWAPRGKEGLRLATEWPDLEMVFISDATSSPSAAETVQMLRSSARSRDLPAAIMVRDLPIDLVSSPTRAYEEMLEQLGRKGQEGVVIPDVEELAGIDSGRSRLSLQTEVDLYRRRQFDRFGRYAEEDPLLLVIPPPRSPESTGFAVRQLLALPGDHRGKQMVTIERRAVRSGAILDWLADAIDTPLAGHFEWSRLENDVLDLLYQPNLSARASKVLGRLSTPKSQQILADVASQPALTRDIRRASAEALHEAIGRRGVLLTQDAILRQYDRYNASESFDPDTRAILGTVLDAIELPSAQRAAANGTEGR
jgi:hypothetical protein